MTHSQKIATIVSALLRWFPNHARDLPWRQTRDPYAIWVSEIMLQQTQVATVIPFWERWMRDLPTIQALARTNSQRIHKLWEGLGYYTRVRNMQQAARLIMQQHQGRFPNDYDAVLALPGIGRYTAGAICSIAFNQPRPILDGNVIRVLTRLYGIDGNPRDKLVNEKLWNLAGILVRQADAAGSRNTANPCSQLNQSLMELGALVCVPKQPQCDRCPLAQLCVARKRGRAESLPATAPRAPVTRRRYIAFVVKQAGKVLVRQRPSDVVNAHLWEFPNMEVSLDDGDPTDACLKILELKPSKPRHICTIKHTITRYRIQLDAFEVDGKRASQVRPHAGRWFRKRDLVRLPFTSAHKKILGFLGRTADAKS